MLAAEWSQARKEFIESLGHVTQHWTKRDDLSSTQLVTYGSTSTGTGVGGLYPLINGPTLTSASTTRSHLSTDLTTTTATNQDSNIVSELMKKHINIFQRLNNPTLKPANKTFKPCLELASVITVPSFLEPSSSLDTTSTTAVGSKVDENGLSRVDLLVYQSLVEMLGYMVGETHTYIQPGVFSSICFSLPTFSITPSTHQSSQFQQQQNSRDNKGSADTGLLHSQLTKHQYLSQGCKTYLEYQHIQVLTNEIDICIQKGVFTHLSYTTPNHTRLHRLKAYLSYLWRSGSLFTSDVDIQSLALWDPSYTTTSYTTSLGATSTSSTYAYDTSVYTSSSNERLLPVWAYIYYCLICGDLSLLLEELAVICNEQHIRHVPSEVYTVLRYYHHWSTSSTTNTSTASTSTSGGVYDSNSYITQSFPIENDLTSTQINEFKIAYNIIKNLYNNDINQSYTTNTNTSMQSFDPYRILVLNLISLSDVSALADTAGIPPFAYTLQSYIWCNIWFITYERYVIRALGGTGGLYYIYTM